MKMKIIIFLSVALMISASSCKTQEKVANFLKTKCADSSVSKQSDGSYKVSIHCVNLYATDKVKEYLPVGKVTYDVSEAELSIVGVSKDSVPDVLNILRSIANGIKK